MSDPLLAELEARLRGVETVLEDLADAVAAAPAPAPPGDGAAAAEERAALAYPDLEARVRDVFASTYGRSLGGEFRWCPRWWAHPEAVGRLEALWRAWEALRLDAGTGMGVWYRDHLDHHLPILLGSRGPFRKCSPEDGHEPADALPVEPAPEGWWPAP